MVYERRIQWASLMNKGNESKKTAWKHYEYEIRNPMPGTVDHRTESLSSDTVTKLDVSFKSKIEQNRLRALELRRFKAKSSSDCTSSPPTPPASTSSQTTVPISRSIPNSDAKASQYGSIQHLVSCALKTSTRINLITKFHSQVVNIIKVMSTRQYDPNSSQWSLDIGEYEEFLRKMKPLEPQVTPVDLHTQYAHAFYLCARVL